MSAFLFIQRKSKFNITEQRIQKNKQTLQTNFCIILFSDRVFEPPLTP